MRSRLVSIIVALILALGAVVYLVYTTQRRSSTDVGASPGVEVGGVVLTPSKSLVENADLAPTLTTFTETLAAADLTDTLSGPGPFTVFAPTNEAFLALPAGELERLLQPESKPELGTLLTYHIVPGRLGTADFTDGRQLVTVNGRRLLISVVEDQVFVNVTRIQAANITSTNGVLHLVGEVLAPEVASPSPTASVVPAP